MKKFLLGIMMVILLSACSISMGKPKQKVIELLDKYKNQDQTIISQLDDVIGDEYTNSQYKERYKTLMINQYKNMEYKITEEEVEGDNAVVEAEITVYDYASALRNANDYLSENPDKFAKSSKETKNENQNKETNTNDYDEDKFTDYKITQMENATDKVTYTIEFTLTKVNGKWQLDSMSNSDIEKIHGIYIQG